MILSKYILFIVGLNFCLLGQKADFNIESLSQLSFEELLNIDITTAGKKEEKITEIPASVIVITREEIEAYGFANLSEILENIPGMYKVNDYSWDGHDKFGVRGFWSNITNDNLLIFVNNINQQDNHHTNYPLDKIAVPVEVIDRIEVVRGPMSVMYGSGAFFGAINIFTNQVEEDVTQVTASIGTQNTKKVSVKKVGVDENYKFVINAGINSSSGIDQPYSKMMTAEAAVAMPTSGTKDLLEANELYMNFSGEYKGFYADFSYIKTQNEFYLIEPSFSNGSMSKYITSNAVIGYRDEIAKKLTIDAKLGFYSTNHKLDYDFYFENSLNNQVLQGEAYELDLNFFYDYDQEFKLTFGYNFRNTSDIESRVHIPSSGWGVLYNLNSRIAPGESIITHGLFTQAEFKPFPDFKLVAGLRAEQMLPYTIQRIDATDSLGVPPLFFEGKYEQDDIHLIPRLALLYEFDEKNVLKFLYGKAINNPSFWHLHALLLFGKMDLYPEEIQTYEINYFTVLSDYFSINASLFYNDLNNLIMREHGLDDEGNYYDIERNSGELSTTGFELTLLLRPVQQLHVEISASYYSSDDKTYNKQPGYSPEILGYIKTYYELNKHITISLTGSYVGEMYSAWVQDADGSGHRLSDNKANSYFLFNSNIRVTDVFSDEFFLDLKCSNIFNSDIYYPTFTNNLLFTKGTLGMGRSILLTAGIKI